MKNLDNEILALYLKKTKAKDICLLLKVSRYYYYNWKKRNFPNDFQKRKIQFQNIINDCNDLYQSKYYLTSQEPNSLISKTKKFLAYCPIKDDCGTPHGWWPTSWINLIYHKCGCPKCGIFKLKEKLKSPWEDVIKKNADLNKVRYTTITLPRKYPEYKNCYSKVTAFCEKHQHSFFVSVTSLLSNKRTGGCKHCISEKLKEIALKKAHTIEDVRTLGIKKFKGKYSYIFPMNTLYVGRTAKFSVQCKTCNTTIETTYQHHFYDKFECRNCLKRMSSFEKKIADFLTDNTIKFLFQWSHPKLKGLKKRPLPFDFFLPDYNIIIEFHGTQHFRPGRGGVSGLLKLINNDYKKEKFADSMNIQYILLKDFHLKNLYSVFKKKLRLENS